MHKKYLEDFDKLCRNWEKLKLHPSREGLEAVLADLDEMEYDLKHMEL